jgi:DNA-binding protein H-NS
MQNDVNMTKLQLESMSFEELWALHEKISRLLPARIVEEKQQLGRRLEQLSRMDVGRRPKARRIYRKVPPKYRNPQVPDVTWSGRGKTPKWVVKALSNGARKEGLLISSEQDHAAFDRAEV